MVVAIRSYSSSSDSLSTFVLVVIFLALMLFSPLACGAMIDDDDAIRAAEDVGWTEVEIVDKAVFWIEIRGCGERDDARFTVRGVSPSGEVREAYVCDGVLKGGTFRSK